MRPLPTHLLVRGAVTHINPSARCQQDTLNPKPGFFPLFPFEPLPTPAHFGHLTPKNSMICFWGGGRQVRTGSRACQTRHANRGAGASTARSALILRAAAVAVWLRQLCVVAIALNLILGPLTSEGLQRRLFLTFCEDKLISFSLSFFRCPKHFRSVWASSSFFFF